MNEYVSHINYCRSCNSGALKTILDYGDQPLANGLRDVPIRDKPVVKYPITLAFCETCTLVQIKQTIDPSALFQDYLYFSSQSKTMVDSAKDIAQQMIRDKFLDESSLVIEAASNDGYLLQFYKEAGVPVLGIDPARNIAELANSNGIETLPTFFNKDVAMTLSTSGRQADVFHANNVLAHVADLNGFVAGIAEVLKDDGTAVIEVPYLGKMFDQLEFDQVYHEHLCYYSVTSLRFLFLRHGLHIVAVEPLTLHGGSIRIFVEKKPREGSNTQSWLDLEYEQGMRSFSYYSRFAADVNKLGMRVWQDLWTRKRTGHSILGYGAAAKGNVFLSYLGIDQRQMQFVLDSTPAKQNKYMAGADIPIIDPSVLLTATPHAIIILAWNFADEIVAKEQGYLERGGEFLAYLPTFKSWKK
jgi:SAM-dependent methyltransferase